MKTCLAFVLLLAGCSPSNPASIPVVTYYTPLQQAVIEIEKQHELLSDSSLRFSKPTPFTRRDSISGSMYQRDRTLAYIIEQQKRFTEELATGTTPVMTSDEQQRFVQSYSAEIAAYKQDLQRAQKRSPNHIVGQQIIHVYRINGRVDSTQFVVFNTGEVCRLEHVKHVEGMHDYSFTLMRDPPPFRIK